MQWLMRFLPAAGGRDGDPPMEAVFGPERDEVLQPDDSSGSLVLVGGAYPPLPWSLLPGSPEEGGATLTIANFPPHAVRRSPIDGGWVSWNDNVVLWTVDSILEHTAAALKDLGNAQFRRGECLEALVTYGEAVSALLGGRQHESQMQSIGFVPPISWSTTEGNTWPEYVWLPDTAAQVWAKLTANIPAAVLRAIKLGLIPPGSLETRQACAAAMAAALSVLQAARTRGPSCVDAELKAKVVKRLQGLQAHAAAQGGAERGAA